MNSGMVIDWTPNLLVKASNEYFGHETDLSGDAPGDEVGMTPWRHLASHVIRTPIQGRPNELFAKVTLPRTRDEIRGPNERYQTYPPPEPPI
jgi:hypothetical protein